MTLCELASTDVAPVSNYKRSGFPSVPSPNRRRQDLRQLTEWLTHIRRS